jgi:hypothetical protein
MKFTPGPWSEEYINAVLRYARKNSGPWDETPDDGTFEPDDSDSSLIAAAPEMLECLINLEVATTKGKLMSSAEALNKIKGIIEKATGQKIEEVLK